MFIKSLLAMVAVIAGANAGAATYGCVDTQKILMTVKEGAAAKAKLEKEEKDKGKIISTREEEVRKMYAEYQKKSLVMSDDKKMEEQQKIQKKVQEGQELSQQFSAQMQKRQMELIQPIIENIKNTTAEVAAKEKFDMVYDKNQSGILYASSPRDVTDEVIKLYDEKFKPGDSTTADKKGKKGKK